MKTYLTKIKFKEDVRSIKKGLELNISKPFFALAGLNGSGKSTLLNAVRSHLKVRTIGFHADNLSPTSVETKLIKDTPVLYYDFHADDMKFATVFGDNVMGQIQAMRSSSGMASIGQFIDTGIHKAKDSLIILDEPCRGLSIKMEYKFINLFVNLLLNNNQIFMSTHSHIFMKFAERIGHLYSLDHKKEFYTFDEYENVIKEEIANEK
jgi:predicted ATPase